MAKGKVEEFRYRKRYHKNAHDRKLRDPFWMKLTFEEKGLLSQVECMVASTMDGDGSGVLYGEDGRKITVDEFLFLIGGDEEHVTAILNRLCRARQIDARVFKSGSIKLVHWYDDQELPATGDGERKRASAEAALVDEAKAFRPDLEKWFAKHGRESVTESDLLHLIKARRGGYVKTQLRFLSVLFSAGVLVKDSSALASLAPPPSGAGVGADSCRVGDGLEIVPGGKFPVDKNLEPEPEKDSPSGIQLVPAGADAHTRPCLEGGRSERSEAELRSDYSDSPRSADSVHAVPPSREERPIQPPTCVEDCLYEPSDAFRVDDPVQAAERLLCETAGWNSVAPLSKADLPLSQDALLARWSAMRKDYGPKVANLMWRECLRVHIADMITRRAERRTPPRSWTGLFMSSLNKMRPADVQHLVKEAV